MLSDSQLRMTVQPELKPNEEILWVGRPNVHRLTFTSSNIFAFLFAIFWEGFVLTGFLSTWKPGGGFNFAVSGIPAFMLLCGLALLLSPVAIYFKGLSTIYAVTNKRAIIITTWLRRSVQSFGSADIGALERTDQPDGSGDLSFAKKSPKIAKVNAKKLMLSLLVFRMFARLKTCFVRFSTRVGSKFQ